MANFPTTIRSLVSILALASGAAAQAPAPTTRPLEAKTLRPGDVWLPAEKWADVGGGIPVRHGSSERFAALLEGEILRADLDGDGKPDAKVEGEEGSLTLLGTSPEGHAIRYVARLARFNKGPWKFSCGSAMQGTIGDTKIQVIDQNLNGSFDDVGEDAIVIGRDGAASFLSRVVSVGGELFEIQVARDGSSITYAPYAGARGTLDLASQFTSKAKLVAAVVKSADGKLSFNLAKAKGGLAVPAAEYALVAGALALGESKASIAGGRSKPIGVAANEAKVVAWGGPVSCEFAYARQGDAIQFTPWDIWYYGKLGEEYSSFLPLGTSPEFAILENGKAEPLVYAKFPGNC